MAKRARKWESLTGKFDEELKNTKKIQVASELDNSNEAQLRKELADIKLRFQNQLDNNISIRGDMSRLTKDNIKTQCNDLHSECRS